MNLDVKNFPPQKLPMSQKDENWKKASLDAVIARKSRWLENNKSREERIKIEQDLFEGIFDERDLKYVTDPYKVGDSFPASLQNMNIIRPKLNLLIGEESKRPYSYTVIQSNDDAISEVEVEIKETIADYFATIYGQNPEQAELTDDQLQELENQIDKIKSRYRNPAENTAQHTLNYLKYNLNLSDQFLKGWGDYLKHSEEIYYCGIVNGEPYFERVDPRYVNYDTDPEVEFIQEGDWLSRRIPMTASAIYDRFYDIMDESDLDEVLKLVEGGVSTSGYSTGSTVHTKSIMWKDQVPTGTYLSEEHGYGLINVWHGVWRSYKKVGFLTYVDEDGEVQEDIVDETYKPDEDEDITWEWAIEIWEGYRIGSDIYVGIQPIQYQSVSIDQPNAKRLPYVGIPHKSRSMVDIMKPLQYMYIILWYRLELALARDKGKVVTMDVTQIPKSMGIDTNRWLHMLNALGVNLVNPYEEGWDIPGREGGKPAQFNQFSSMDLTMSNVIAQYIELMNKIEEMIGELSGVTRQREGTISSSELVGNVQRAVIQSSHITEPLFWVHNQVKKHALQALLDVAKYAWADSDKKKLHYFLEDSTRIFLDITDSFLYSDFDVFVMDPTMEDRNLEILRNLLQPAMQNGATLTDAINILTTNNLSEIKRQMAEIDERRERMQQQVEQQQRQIEQSRVEAEREARNMEFEKDVLIAREENQTAIEVELIKQEANLAKNSNIIKDTLDTRKLQLQQEKQATEARIKSLQLGETIRSNKADEELKRMQIKKNSNSNNKK